MIIARTLTCGDPYRCNRFPGLSRPCTDGQTSTQKQTNRQTRSNFTSLLITQFMTEYDRSHMGTVEEEVEFGGDAASSNHRLQDAVQDFVRNYTEQTMRLELHTQ